MAKETKESTKDSKPTPTTLSKNIKHLRTSYPDKLTQERLGERLSTLCEGDEMVTRNQIASYEDARAEPKIDLLGKIADFFSVSLDDLINKDLRKLDRSEILNSKSTKDYASGDNLRLLTVTVDNEGNENIVFINQKAAAGYTKGYTDEEYFEALPHYHLPFLPKHKSYRAFEITGESMLPILPGSIVIAEHVENWMRDIRDGDTCIVVMKDEGIVLKKVYNHIDTSGKVVLKSTNILYSPYEVEAEEVIEIWKYTALISREVPEAPANYDELKEAFWRLEDEVRNIKMSRN